VVPAVVLVVVVAHEVGVAALEAEAEVVVASEVVASKKVISSLLFWFKLFIFSLFFPFLSLSFHLLPGPPETVQGIFSLCVWSSSFSPSLSFVATLFLPLIFLCVCLEMGVMVHPCENAILIKASSDQKIPHFNAPIYLENKQQIGKVEEVLGPINELVTFFCFCFDQVCLAS
jgi:hypothetical protein